jgi:CHAT domain-containing protein
LPETADELCAVARQLGADEREVNLGARATETRVKQLNGEGALGQARVLHFATHGLIASETESVAKSLAEPALLLTPPDSATATDDGLLTASEVTELKLDADWVVLSACNTAAAGEDGSAEALSGLARAFFFAGARALLVSHWYVDSRAAVQITTTAFAELKRDPKIGRAEALRRAMLAAMNDPGRPRSWTPAAHPAVWAPFVVVGEGGGTTADSTSAMITGTKTQSPATASVPDATSSLQPVEVVPEPKAKGKAARRRKPTSEWDWFYDLW